jgi:DNA repair protein Rad10
MSLNLDFSFLSEEQDGNDGQQGGPSTSTEPHRSTFSHRESAPTSNFSSSSVPAHNSGTSGNHEQSSSAPASHAAGQSGQHSNFAAAFAHIKATPSYVPPAPRAENARPAQQLRAPNPRAILVSRRQKGNPLLNSIRNVPWEYGDIVPDYQMGSTSQTCALFLSVRYHMQKRDYIYGRMQQLQKGFKLRVLVCLVDQEECQKTLLDVHTAALVNGWTLILAWSPEEAAR